MLYEIQHRLAAFRHILGQPDIPLPDLTRQRPSREIVLNHAEDRENRLVRIDRTKLTARDSFPNSLRNAQMQGAVVRDNHPVKAPPVRHHFPLDQPRIGGIAHYEIKGSVNQRTYALGRLHREHFWRFHRDANLSNHCFKHEAMKFLFVAEIIVGKGFVDSGGARDLVHPCTGKTPLGENFSRGHNNSPHRRELPAFLKKAPPNR